MFAIASVINFDWLFTQFHIASFNNSYWMLDPSTDYLIMLFPGGFWQDIAWFGCGLILAETLFTGSIAWRIRSRRKEQIQ
jgi:integral membrane protein (TIGR01906 family)